VDHNLIENSKLLVGQGNPKSVRSKESNQVSEAKKGDSIRRDDSMLETTTKDEEDSSIEKGHK
jgi:hypothetical protein